MPHHHYRYRHTATLAAVTLVANLVVLGAAGGTAAAAVPAATQEIPGSVPRWATAANDAGTPDDAPIEGEIYLPLRDQAGAQALATAVSTPGNAKYGQHLSPRQWISTYAPTEVDLKAVTDYVSAQGLTIIAVPDSRQYVVFRGSASTINAAFSTTLHNYTYSGRQLVAPSAPPKVPAAVAAKLAGVTIDQGRYLTRPDLVAPGAGVAPAAAPAAPAAPFSCSNYYGQHVAATPLAYGRTSYPTSICGYTPGQLRSAYNLDKGINAGNDGSGQTVAIIDAYASPSIVSDTNTYALRTGSPPLTSATYRQIIPAVSEYTDTAECKTTANWQSEQTLDVQSAHGVAPGAQILYVGGFNCGGGLDVAMSKILDHKLATIVSNSYGAAGEAVPDSVISGRQNQHIQAAVEGIGLYFSSGDDGDRQAKLGYRSPDFPASSPYVTSVGGTSLQVAANGSYLAETGWGSVIDQISEGVLAAPLPGSFQGGAGGGVSDKFAQPAYQRGVVPNALANSKGGGPARVSPDVASLADPYTGFLIGLSPIVDDASQTTGPFVTQTYGGTSLATPLTAAQVALVQQATGRTLGFANPVLYASYQQDPAITRDVRPLDRPDAVVNTSAKTGFTFLVSLDHDTSLRTTTGYDQTTGLGSIDVPRLIARLER